MTSPSELISGDVRLIDSTQALQHKLQDALTTDLPTREFLREMDELREPFHEIVSDCYGDPYFAKLLYLKVTNYVIARYHRLRLDVRLASRPVTLMLDPSNSCQLTCPGCVHSTNQAFTNGFLWPAGVMRTSTFASLLRQLGPFAVNTILYNYGEPLLNKNIADFIELAHGHGMSVGLSTNLSLKFDVERFVRAGADHVVLSIDGITEQSYSRFRKKGNLGLVLDNVRRMVELKRKHGFAKPYLAWRFLTFEHNLHEVDDAIRLAEEIGVDQIIIATPFDVSIDDPTVRVATSSREGCYNVLAPADRGLCPHPSERLVKYEETERLFDDQWLRRGGEALDDRPHSARGTCVWLYYNITVDATGRVMPCCISPAGGQHLVYGNLADDDGDRFNADGFLLSRLAFADRARFESVQAERSEKAAPYCASCPKAPALTYSTQNGIDDLRALDFRAAVFDPAQELCWKLAQWE